MEIVYSECSVAKRKEKKCPTSKVPSYLERPMFSLCFVILFLFQTMSCIGGLHNSLPKRKRDEFACSKLPLGFHDRWMARKPTPSLRMNRWSWKQHQWRSKTFKAKITHHFRRIYGIYLTSNLYRIFFGKIITTRKSPVGLGNTRVLTDHDAQKSSPDIVHDPSWVWPHGSSLRVKVRVKCRTGNQPSFLDSRCVLS
jgi:hypothetical protein